MKVERISENQIRCTLTKEDLEQRHIVLSELAYGSEKARSLFREMLTEAFESCGFTNDANIPLMIEAIPQRENALVLMITKVEDPEELDTRFSKFSATNVLPDNEGPEVGGADDVLDAFHKFFDQKKGKKGRTAASANASDSALEDAESTRTKSGAGMRQGKSAKAAPEVLVLTRLYLFENLDDVINAAAALRGFYTGKNTLYHLGRDGRYALIAHQSSHTPEDYNKVCNILSEYGKSQKYASATEAFYSEHEETVIANSALQELATLTN